MGYRDKAKNKMERSHPSSSGKQTFPATETSRFSLIMKEVDAVRRRLKQIKVIRGLALFLGILLPVWVLSTITVDHWNYTQHILTLSRIVSLVVLFPLFAYFLLRPLFEQIDEQKVARYIEERHPELKDRLVSVVEFGRNETGEDFSNPFFPLLLRDALKSCQMIKTRSLFSRRASWLPASIAGLLIFGFAAALSFGPSYVRYATFKLYMPWWLEKAPPLYSIHVKPGTVELSKGSELLVTASLIGLDRSEVYLFSRHENSPDWEKRQMDSDKGSNAFRFLFLDVNEDLRYYVQSGTIRSEEFSITTIDQPHVQQIDVTYHYPAYTGLPVRTDEDVGEIAGIRGTNVTLTIHLSRDVSSGRILLQEGTPLPLEKNGPNHLQGSFKLSKDSSYRIQLLDPGRNFVTASNEYPIKVLDDQPPMVSFQKPGRDTKVTLLEEVVTEVKASDDFGIRSLTLHFSVNGGKENVVPLFGDASFSMHGPADPGAEKPVDLSKALVSPGIKFSRSLAATHTFFLEEFKLEPGDLISYFATASDVRSLTTSDIYFLEVRPFGKQYSQRPVSQESEADASASDTVLSIRQKEILAATWRLIRDRKTFREEEYENNLKLVTSQQYKLQQQTQTLSERIQRRALTIRDKDIQKLSENLIKAIAAMSPAGLFLSAGKPAEAVSPEQISLQNLLRAEAYYKQVQVAYGKIPGAQGESLGAQELENLFELELDKLKNQFETQQHGSHFNKNVLDEALQQLKELARRQQKLLENKKRQLGPQMSLSANRMGSEFQAIEQESQKLARQLERLSREMQDPALDRASQQMRQASEDLHASEGSFPRQDSDNRGLQALSRMNEVQQLLERKLNGNLTQEIGRLKNSAQNLSRRQEHVQQRLDSMERQSIGKPPEPSFSGRNLPGEHLSQEKQQILQEKDELAQSAARMGQELRDTARKASHEDKALSEKLQAAADFIRESRLEETVQQGGRLISRDLFEMAQQTEKQNLLIMKALQQRLESAEKSLPLDRETSRINRLSEALNRTDDLAVGLESLSRRILEMQQASLRQATTAPRVSMNKEEKTRETLSHSRLGQSKPGEPAEELSMQEIPAGGKSAPTTPSRSQDANFVNRNGQSGERTRPNEHGTQLSRAESRVNAMGETENQAYGNIYSSDAAVNFGDNQLPPPLSLGDDRLKQLAREFAIRIQEAQDLSKHLQGEDALAHQLRNMIDRLHQMGNLKFASDAKELDKLNSSVIDGLHELELRLSRDLQMLITQDSYRFSKDDDVPLPYRVPVEEYYKALSKK